MRKSLSIIAVAVAGLSVTACHKDSAKLQGQFLGAAAEPIYLERVTPGSTSVIDSTRTNEKGEFSFKIKINDRQPTIFNVRHGSDDIVPLLISPGEKIKVNSYGNVARSYRVSGSTESQLVAQLHAILNGGVATLDSISNLFALSSPDGPERRELTREYYNEYYRIKREQIRFIVEHSSSLVAVYALYQRLPGDDVLFNGDSDFVYYQMVADSVNRYYPDSRYVMALMKEVEANKAARTWMSTDIDEIIQYADFPDLELPNMYGQKVNLSSLAGNVIILDFWSAALTESRINNAEMKELYSELGGDGLAIYQVSLDTSKPLWVNAVQEQKLPWITVCDFRGEQSVAVGTYNVSAIPANFIIDREGNIAAKNIFGGALEQKVRELI